MDPLSVTALITLLSKLFDGTTGKVGEQLWDDLTSVVRRTFGRRSTSVEAAKRLGERPGDPDTMRALAEALIADSARDPQGAAQIRHWVVRAERAMAQGEAAADALDRPAAGQALQSRDANGGITF